GLPLKVRDSVVGTITGLSRHQRVFTPVDMEMMSSIGNMVGMAIANARLFEEQKCRAEQLAALHQVSQAVSQSLDLEAVAGLALEATLGALGLDVGTIRYVDETTQEVVLLTQRGLPEEMLEERRARPRVKIGESLAGRVAQSGQILVVDAFSHGSTSVYETSRNSGFESYIGIPLKVKGRVVGMVSAVSRRRYTLPQAAMEVIDSLGSLVGMAIANARLHTVTDAALQQRAAEMESIISGMGEGLMVVNAQRRVDYCNKAAEELLGISSADFMGQPVEVFNSMLSTRIVEPEEWRRVLAAELGKGDGQPRFHFVVQHSERREIDAALFSIESGGKRLGTGAVLRDVTRERELDRMKTEFISHASHELRTPLSVIHGFIELLLRYKASPTDQRAWLEEAHQESQRLTSIVDDLLNVSRIESGGLALNLQRVALESLTDDLVRQVSFRYPSHSVYCDIPEGFPAIWADAERLAYVLHNLMDNAAKYSPRGGPVTVSARWDEESSQAVIAVADQGLGIPKTEMSHLFARFHRIRRPETEGIRGSGLGLYIAKSLVEMMGGRIWAESSLN
ncbi:MAG: ATP-binding protein, partial [Dehalococcoidia bacterium]